MKLEKKVYIENTATTGELSSITIRGYMEDKERETLYNLRDKKVKLTLEVQEPILDEAERKYLSGVIRPFRNRVKCIKKEKDSNKREYISITYDDGWLIPLAFFENNAMYKNMELNKEYTLEELGL